MSRLVRLLFFELQYVFPQSAREWNDRSDGDEADRDVQHRIETTCRGIDRYVKPFEGWDGHGRIIENRRPIGQLHAVRRSSRAVALPLASDA